MIKPTKPTIFERILMFCASKDSVFNRDKWKEEKDKKYLDHKEAIYLYSPYYVHSKDMILLNIVYWEELTEHSSDFNKFKDNKNNDLLLGVASISHGTNIKFSKALSKLIKEDFIKGFNFSLKALKGFGGKNMPLMDVYDHESHRSRPSEIIAISLTDTGYEKGKLLLSKYNSMDQAHWFLPKMMYELKEFHDKMFSK